MAQPDHDAEVSSSASEPFSAVSLEDSAQVSTGFVALQELVMRLMPLLFLMLLLVILLLLLLLGMWAALRSGGSRFETSWHRHVWFFSFSLSVLSFLLLLLLHAPSFSMLLLAAA